MISEQDRVKEIISNMSKGNEVGQKLVYDKVNKTVRTVSEFTDPDNAIEITPEDTKFSSELHPEPGMIVISGELIEKLGKSRRTQRVFFARWDDGDVYTLLREGYSQASVSGSISLADGPSKSHVSVLGEPDDHVRVIVNEAFEQNIEADFDKPQRIVGYVKHQEEWKEVLVQIVPVRNEIFSRFGGILETDALAGKRVFVVGVGAVGSRIALEFSKQGVIHSDLMDHDRLEVANIARHAAGLSDVGRYKTKVMAEMIHERNPYAEVCVKTEKVSWDNIGTVRGLVKQADIVICAADEMRAKLIINRLCLEEKTTCIFAGAFRRAYGGQILFFHPGESPCYQCFLMLIPEQAKDIEVSNRTQAEALAYTDRPVEIEPGLSNDIAPINTMVVKLAIQELLKGTQTSLRSLDEDLVAPWYIWLNRREKGTQYEKLGPLEFNVDGMRILRWYGIDIKRHEACPVCGNFEQQLAKQNGIQLNGMDR
jgi:molybdopterin/thiamine biosynthesis adenylyltransferase